MPTMVSCVCEECGKMFARELKVHTASKRNKRRTFCSRQCSGKWVGENLCAIDKEELKERNRIKRHKYYEKNKQWYKDAAKRARVWITQYKANSKCAHCGESDPICLVFHHVNPATKKYNVCQMASSCSSIERIQKEIDKCIILCSNCHRKLHHEKRSNKH